MESVGAKFEQTTELARGRGGPEGEFLHEGDVFVGYEGFELFVEGGEAWVVLDGVEGAVVAGVALVFPDVHYAYVVSLLESQIAQGRALYQMYRNLPLLFSNCQRDGPCSRAYSPSSGTNPPPT